MPISTTDFQRACTTYKLNWPGSGNDGLTVAQRFDQLQAADVTEDRVRQLVADAVKAMPPPPTTTTAGMTEARVRQLIAEAIAVQHPLDEPTTTTGLLLSEGGDPILLEEGGPDSELLTEAATARG